VTAKPGALTQLESNPQGCRYLERGNGASALDMHALRKQVFALAKQMFSPNKTDLHRAKPLPNPAI